MIKRARDMAELIIVVDRNKMFEVADRDLLGTEIQVFQGTVDQTLQ